MKILIIIAVMTLITFSTRAISMLIFAGRRLSPITQRGLSLVPVAILSAICAPLVFMPLGELENPIYLVEFWAALGSIFCSRFGTAPAIIVGIFIYCFGKMIF